MRDIERLCDIIEEELGKIAEKGLTTGNLETAYKLIDMYKDLKNTKYWDTKSEYYMEVLSEMRGGYSQEDNYSNRQDNRGRYSRADGRMAPDYEQESSYANRGKHYVRGHYSRLSGHDPYMDYMDGKQSYRSGGRTEDCKNRMIGALEEHMEMLTQDLGEMSKDSDCREERETIKRYIDKLRNMIQ